MTLVVSEVSKFGIAMAADSAITTRYHSTFLLQSGKPAPPTVRTGAQEIVPISAINAVISVWGLGTIGTPVDQDVKIPIDKFLSDFAESVNPRDELDEVGEKLAKVVNARIRIGEVRRRVSSCGLYSRGWSWISSTLSHTYWTQSRRPS